MNNDTAKKGIAGAIMGVSLVLGSGYNPDDIDPRTNVSYRDIIDPVKGEVDIYYIPLTADIPEAYWGFVHQKPETARVCGDRTLLKADLNKVPMDLNMEKMGKPYSHEQILTWLDENCVQVEEQIDYLSNLENGFYDPNEII